jgi:hypothetical protein
VFIHFDRIHGVAQGDSIVLAKFRRMAGLVSGYGALDILAATVRSHLTVRMENGADIFYYWPGSPALDGSDGGSDGVMGPYGGSHWVCLGK